MIALAARHALPAIYSLRELAAAGGLILHCQFILTAVEDFPDKWRPIRGRETDCMTGMSELELGNPRMGHVI
jgi:hypothetical protein